MAADGDDANIIPMEGRSADGSENRWPRCVIGSGVAHLVLLAACVLLHEIAADDRIPDAEDQRLRAADGRARRAHESKARKARQKIPMTATA